MKRDRFVLVKPASVYFGEQGLFEKYFQRRTRDGRPVTTTNLRLAQKFDTHSEACRVLQVLIQRSDWKNGYVGNA